jgi:hypothetical protein
MQNKFTIPLKPQDLEAEDPIDGHFTVLKDNLLSDVDLSTNATDMEGKFLATF